MKAKDPYELIHKLYFKKRATAYCLKESKHPITFKAIKSHFGQIYQNYYDQNEKRKDKFRKAPTRDDISTYFLSEDEWNLVTKELGATLESPEPFRAVKTINQSKVITIYLLSPNRPFFKYTQKQE